MSSPVRTPRTPSRNGEQSPRVRTPRQPTTPSSRSSRSSRVNGTPSRPGAGQRITTPLRGQGGRFTPQVSGASERSSSAVPSSPYKAPVTSPFVNFDVDLSSPLNYGTPSSMSSVGPRSVHGTPIKRRTDIGGEKRLRLLNRDPIPEEGAQPSSEQDDGANANLVIWGTDISVNRCKKQFKYFVERFIDPEAENDELPQTLDLTEPLYMQKLEEIALLEEPFLNINCAHLQSFNEELYKQLICYPQELLPVFDMAANEMFFEKNSGVVLNHQIQVRPFNVTTTKSMRELNPEDVDQLVTVHGMVIRTSNIIPEMREGFFKCTMCSHTSTSEIERGRITEPTLCTQCNNKFCFTLIHNRSTFSDKQMVKLQESPDDMTAGSTPQTVVLFAHNDLVDAVHPGDRVAVTGIYRAVPFQINPRMSNVKSVYRTHIDVIHFRKQDSKRLHDMEDGQKHAFTPDRVEILKLLSQKPDVYERLANNLAPSIFGNEDVKKGILLQLFGGTRDKDTVSGRTHFRSDINILLCGDPGTSKSQLLSYVYNLVPRSQYSSGKGSSAVGLTAYVTKDPESRQMVLQTGALVLADNGICCIDEFDKMNDTTRSVLHEVMEQQTLSIAKAGIICQLNARTSILAAANPVESQWNKDKSIIENVNLPHTLLSRFDLIYLILDSQDEAFDKRLARHLISLYYKNEPEGEDDLVDMSILRDYLVYAKEHFTPKLGDEAQQKLIKTYVDIRRSVNPGQISAYPRQLESLIRLSEAHAKMRFSPTVEVKDVEEAYRLHREALKSAVTDPVTGLIDMNILATGQASSHREEVKKIAGLIREHFKVRDKMRTLYTNKLLQELRESSQLQIQKERFEDAITLLHNEDFLMRVGTDKIRINAK